MISLLDRNQKNPHVKEEMLLIYLPFIILSVFSPTLIAEQSEYPSCLPQYRFDGEKVILTKDEWKKRLTPEQYRILREGGTEPSYDNLYNDWKKPGIYQCAGCYLPLFSSKEKYDSKTGWPSFWEPICPKNVSYKEDYGLFSKRIEVLCSRCDGHLGHVFDDGPPPTGKRYCINSAALYFVSDAE